MSSLCMSFLTANNPSVPSKLACLLLTISFTLFFSGYVSVGWISGTDKRETNDNITNLNIGLWQACFNNYQEERICQSTSDFLQKDWNEAWLPGSQGIFSTAFAFGLGSMAVCWSYVLLPKYQEGPLLVFVAACSSFASFTLLFLGMLIIGIQQSSDTVNFYDTKLDWAFGMTVTATGITGVACFLLMGDFYEILLSLSKKKKLNRQNHVLRALDEATVDTNNSSRTYTRNPDRPSDFKNSQEGASPGYRQDSDTNSLDSSSPLYKNISKSPQSLSKQLPAGIINHTSESCGDLSGEESDVTCVRVRKQTGHLYDNNAAAMNNKNTPSNFVNDGSKPSTSSVPPLYDNKVTASAFSDNSVTNRQPEFNQRDLLHKTSLDTEHDDSSCDNNDPSKSSSTHVSKMFDIAKEKECPTKKTQTTPVNLFRASQDSNIFHNNGIPRYSTKLPPLGNVNHNRASYATSLPQTSWYYNGENQLVKSTPTSLFLTATACDEDFKRFQTNIKGKSSQNIIPAPSSEDKNEEKTYDQIQYSKEKETNNHLSKRPKKTTDKQHHDNVKTSSSQDITLNQESTEKEVDGPSSYNRLLPLPFTQQKDPPVDSPEGKDSTMYSTVTHKNKHKLDLDEKDSSPNYYNSIHEHIYEELK